ncbi:MAG: redoxin family protein [Planctomyces sp.]|nr:redoxin family protein [Planctomyces sp.]
MRRHVLAVSSALLMAAGCAKPAAPPESTATATNAEASTTQTSPAADSGAAANSETDARRASTPATAIRSARPSGHGVGAAESGTPADAASTVPNAPSDSQPIESAAPAKLEIGSPAPPLAIASYFQGEPVHSFEPGKVHIVEFWATWCGPCLMSMPHIAELQQHYGDDLRVIGVTREEPAVVEAFLKKEHASGKPWSEVITYRLALDDSSKMNESYMRAAGQNGIPTAFVVGRDGYIEWIGHPMAMDAPLAKVVDGSWDRIAARQEFLDQQQMQVALRTLRLKQLKAESEGNWSPVVEALDELIEKYPSQAALKLQKLAIVEKAGLGNQSESLANAIVESGWDQAQLLNQISWGIATKKLGGSLDLAHRAAARAAELTNEKDASILDTLALVHFERGEAHEALELQRKAVALAPGNGPLEVALARYMAATGTAVEPASEPPASETTDGASAEESDAAPSATEAAAPVESTQPPPPPTPEVQEAVTGQ